MRVKLAARLAAGSAIVALFAVSIAFATSYPDRISVLPNLQVDAATYDAIALDLSHRKSLDAIPPLQPPGFVALLAIVFTLFGHSWMAARLALCLCLAAIICVTGFLARSMYKSEAAGWCAALLCAVSPGLRAYSGTLQYELVAALALVLLVGAAHRVAGIASPRRRLAASIGLGLGLGLATLTREVLGAAIPVTAAYLFVRIARQVHVRHAAAAALACLVCAAALPATWSALQSARV